MEGLFSEDPGNLGFMIAEFFINSVNSACTKNPLPDFCVDFEPPNLARFEQYMRGYLTALAAFHPIARACISILHTNCTAATKTAASCTFATLNCSGQLASGGDYVSDLKNYPQSGVRRALNRLVASSLLFEVNPDGSWIWPFDAAKKVCSCVFFEYEIDYDNSPHNPELWGKKCYTRGGHVNTCGGDVCYCELPNDMLECPFKRRPFDEGIEKVIETECGAVCTNKKKKPDQYYPCGTSIANYTCCEDSQECYLDESGRPTCGPTCPGFFQCGPTCCSLGTYCDGKFDSQGDYEPDTKKWQCKPTTPAQRPPWINFRYDIIE